MKLNIVKMFSLHIERAYVEYSLRFFWDNECLRIVKEDENIEQR